MRSADYVEMTTTSIAGTSGDGAVTCTQITNIPTFTLALGSQNTTVRYVIEDTVNKKFEQGIGSVASNVLTRTRPQVTWDGSAWDDSTPSPLQFGSSPTSGNIKVRLSATVEDRMAAMPGQNATIAGDSSWRDYPITNNCVWANSGGGTALTAAREHYTAYCLNASGLLVGAQFEVTTAASGTSMKWALYAIGHDGLPGAKIVDFVTTSVGSTGVKTDTATGSWSPAGPVWLPAGWYAIGFLPESTPALRGFSSHTAQISRTPFGRHSGYGYGNTVYVAGNYSTGLPATPSLSGGTMVSASNNLSVPWFGLKVTA